MTGETILWATFPLFLVGSATILSPVFFAGASNIAAGLFLFLGLLLFHRKSLYFPKKALYPAFMGVVFVFFLFYPLIFIAGQNIPAGNTAILSQAEVLFSFLFFGLLGLEKITIKRILGAAIMLLGTTVIMSDGFTWEWNIWNFLVIFATAIAPLANYYQKATVKVMSPIGYTAYRSLFAGIVLVLVSSFFETPLHEISLSREAIFLIITNGIFAFGISKWFWLEGIHRVGVTKAISYNTATPALTLVFAFFLFREIPTIEQLIGLGTVIIGVPLLLSPIKHQGFSGKTIPGDQIGRKLGFPTINIALNNRKQKPTGVYAVHVEISGKKYSGVLHAGSRPTLHKQEYRTEIHVFDFDKEIEAGKTINGEIVRKLRDVQSFTSIEELKQQIERDIKRARRII